MMKLVPFGKALLVSRDLDPVYIIIYGMKREKLTKWLLAYWWFYSVATASLLADSKHFWDDALFLAKDPETPRASERRHFRGRACIKCVEWFAVNYESPEQVVNHLIDSASSVSEVSEFLKGWPLFGPWASFKVADMLERVVGVKINFQVNDLKLFDSPTQGAKLYCESRGLSWEKLGVYGVVDRLEKKFSEFKAPPRYDRPVGVQEIETILCKWKSHLGGHYEIGKDTKEIKHILEQDWGKTGRILAHKLNQAVIPRFPRYD